MWKPCEDTSALHATIGPEMHFRDVSEAEVLDVAKALDRRVASYTTT